MEVDSNGKDAIIIPIWVPGHFSMCVIKPVLKEVLYIDSQYHMKEQGFGHDVNWQQQQEGEEGQWVHQEEEQGEEELAEEGLGGGEEEELCDVMLQLQLDFDLHFSCGEYIYNL
ncbi:unnamed protein product [Arctogadus glacialis]